MLLAKSCMKKNNIKNGTIRLGSLHEYRGTEVKFICDKQEGYLKFKLKFEGRMEISRINFNTLNQGAIQVNDGGIRFPGRTTSWPSFNIIEANENTVTIENSHVTLERHALNSFIFCMSNIQEPVDCIGIFPEYDDYWVLNQSRIQAFGQETAHILANSIRSGRESGQHVVPEHINLDELEIRWLSSDVDYIHRENNFNTVGGPELNEFISLMSNIEFIKPPIPFEKEKEYRFKFTLVSNGKIIEPLTKSLIIDSNTLIPLISNI